jgi:iron(III) transport system ATP-binding protein
MQRVALARSLVYRPKLLLLDEPLSNLDTKLRVRLRDDLRRILKTANVTGLYVTHDQEEAVVIGDRIGVMNEGKLIQIDDPITLYNRPVDAFVADFTGATNHLRGEVVESGAKQATTRLLDGSTISAVAMSGISAGTLVCIRMRPGNVRLHPSTDDVQNSLTGIITKRAFLGVSIIYDLKVAGFEIQAIESGSRVQFNVGDTVRAAVDPDLAWTYPDIAQSDPCSPPKSAAGN